MFLFYLVIGALQMFFDDDDDDDVSSSYPFAAYIAQRRTLES